MVSDDLAHALDQSFMAVWMWNTRRLPWWTLNHIHLQPPWYISSVLLPPSSAPLPKAPSTSKITLPIRNQTLNTWTYWGHFKSKSKQVSKKKIIKGIKDLSNTIKWLNLIVFYETVLVNFLQLDTDIDVWEKRDSWLRNCLHRLACRQVNGILS